MHDNELPGVRDERIEAEARKQATAAGNGDAAGSWRMEVLAALPDELQTVVRPAATSAVRDRLVAAAALREEPAWLQAAPKWRAVSRWLLCSATVPENNDRVKDIELPRGMQDGVTAILGGLDRRGGGWVDPADAPAPEPEPFETAADWAGPWPDREWLIGGWLPVGRVGMFGGRGGRGKSRLALQLAARLAADPPGVGAFLPPLQTDTWGSRAVGEAGLEIDPSHAGPVVFASWEDEQAEFGRRLEAMATAGLVGPAACLGRLHYIDMRRRGPVWAPASAGSRHILTAAELTAAGASLRATCEQQGAVLLILDSLAGAYASDENQRGLVRSFLSSWDEWGSRQRCAVMLIAHPPKGNSGDRSGEDDDFAGSGDWHAGARWRWVLAPAPTGYTRPGTDTRENEKAVPIKAPRLSLAKASYGPDGAGVFVMSDSLGWRGVSADAAAHGAVPAGTTVVQVGGRNAEAEDEFTIR